MRPSWTATVTAYSPSASAGWSARTTCRSASRPVRPTRARAPRTADQVAGRRRELGPLDLDVVEPDDGVDLEVAHVEALADDLAVDLALLRDVDQARRRGPWPCNRAGGRASPSPCAVAGLHGAEWREAVRRRRDPVLRERPDADRHLAAAADAAPAADRVDVDAERARRVEDRRAPGNLAAPPRRGEDDERLGRAAVIRWSPTAPRARAGATSAVHPPAAVLALRAGRPGTGGSSGWHRGRCPSARRRP